MPVIFQEKFDKWLKETSPVWQDVVIIVTRGEIDKHKKELDEVLGLLEKQGYASFKKSKLFEKKATWCGFAIDEKGISPKEDKKAAVMKINPPNTL